MAQRDAEWRAGKPLATLLVAALAVVAVLGPAAAAVVLARDQAMSAEQAVVEGDARGALDRLNATIGQATAAITQVAAEAVLDGPCGVATTRLMERLALADEWIQAIGNAQGDALTCFSEGGATTPISIGPVDYYLPEHTAVRLDVTFPYGTAQGFIVLERDGVAVVINRSLVLASASSGDVSLGEFSTSVHKMYATRGAVSPGWARVATRPGGVTTFTSHGHIVAVALSRTWRSGTLAAAPLTDVNDRTWRALALLLPLALLAGVVLAGSILWLGRTQLALPAVIRSALRHDEFFVEYQPVVDLETGQWCGAEALMRWRRRSGELVRPDLFIPVAEAAGLGRRVTARLLELTRADAARVFELYPGFRLHLNLTPDDLSDPATAETLQAYAQATGAGPGNLAVEATERDILHPEVTAPIVSSIQAAGFRVVIDDFGTGYSSLAYLERYSFDGIKIDKSFVDTVGTDSVTSQVVFQIIRMAHELEYSMVAEGVESEDQAEVLRRSGVRYAQGWLYAHSMAVAALLDGLATRGTAVAAPARAAEPGRTAPA